MNAVILAMLCVVIRGVAPLSEGQRVQLDTAMDFNSTFDEAGLYPLLNNALQWEKGDEAGAMIPDYKAIFESPGEHRGQLFLIEGAFAGGSQRVRQLSRPGSWDGKLNQWVVVVDRATDEVAVVYLVDPPPAPKAGAKVRTVGRFYKVLSDTDREGRPTNYLTFVGHGAQVEERSSGSGVGSGSAGGALVLVLVILAGGWVVLRQTIRVKKVRTRLRVGATVGGDTEGGIGEEGDEVNLPKDPVQALDVLHDRHEEDGS